MTRGQSCTAITPHGSIQVNACPSANDAPRAWRPGASGRISVAAMDEANDRTRGSVFQMLKRNPADTGLHDPCAVAPGERRRVGQSGIASDWFEWPAKRSIKIDLELPQIPASAHHGTRSTERRAHPTATFRPVGEPNSVGSNADTLGGGERNTVGRRSAFQVCLQCNHA